MMKKIIFLIIMIMVISKDIYADTYIMKYNVDKIDIQCAVYDIPKQDKHVILESRPKFLTNKKTGNKCKVNSSPDCFLMPLIK